MTTEELLALILSKLTDIEDLILNLITIGDGANANLTAILLFIKAFFIILGISISLYIVKWLYYSWIRHWLIELGFKHIF